MAKPKSKRINAAKRPKFAKVATKLPAGFTAVDVGGGFGDWHDFNKTPVLTGKVIELGEFTGEYGKQRTLTVQNGKTASTVSESKALKGLFDTPKIKGKTVFIRYLGAVEFGKANRKGERRTFKQFQCGVK